MEKYILDIMSDKISNIKEIAEFYTYSHEVFFRLACNYYKKGMKVLDIGAGKGDFAKILNDKSVYLLDSNPETVEFLKQSYPNSFLHTMPEPLPFKEKYFDLIHCSHLIEHLQPQEVYSCLVEFDRVLNSNGYLIISAPLLHPGFYCDLSHIKPYEPEIFRKYLVDPGTDNLTREVISKSYKIVQFQYRYDVEPFPYLNISYRKVWIQNLLISFSNFLRQLNFGFWQKTGYTIILQKVD